MCVDFQSSTFGACQVVCSQNLHIFLAHLQQPGPSTSRSGQQQSVRVTYVTVDRRFKTKDTRIIDMSLMRKLKKPPVLTPSSSGRSKQQIPPPPSKLALTMLNIER